MPNTEHPWESRLAIRVTKDAERHIRSGHPWIFDRSLRPSPDGDLVRDGAKAGDLAVIFDHDRRFLAIGLFDPDSPIRIRVLHHGKPATIDDRWLAQSIARALERRRPLLDAERYPTTAFRLVHGENDGLGGLVIDIYDNNAVVKIYSQAWMPWLQYIVAAITDLPPPITRVVLRLSRSLRDSSRFGDGEILHGQQPEDGDVTVEFMENGLRFRTDLQRGHKTGHFLDQRDNRQMIREMSAGSRVLDVFACTGGFSVHAAAGGASSVTSVDVSGPALDLAKTNMTLNSFETDHVNITGDAFAVLEQLVAEGRKFDLVILDPPAFAQRQDQLDRALRAYERLATLGAQLTTRGGLLFQASCSSRISEQDLLHAVRSGLERSGRVGTEQRRTGQPLDHPVGFTEGRYLKAVLVEIT